MINIKYLIKFSYDGSKFKGFQRLNDENSVQKTIENALSVINKNPVTIKGAGRTDSGVHAMNQAAHFNLDVIIPPERLVNAINSLVGDYIHVNACWIVSEDFHARFSAKRKKYVYKIYTGDYNPMLFDYYEFISSNLNLDLMKKAIKLFEGQHYFNNFVSGKRNNYGSIIYKTNLIIKKDVIELEFEGKSFYRYMVRNMVGVILDIGLGKKDITYLEEALNNYQYFKQVNTANPKGLYLHDVIYE